PASATRAVASLASSAAGEIRVHVPKKTVTIAAWNRRRRVSSFIVLLPAATHAASQRSRLRYPARSLSRREIRVHTAGDTLLAREGDQGGDSGDVALGSISPFSRGPRLVGSAPDIRLESGHRRWAPQAQPDPC